MYIVIVAWKSRLGTRSHLMPALAVLVKVKIFAPLDKVVDFIIKLVIFHLLELLVVEWIVIERLKLILESCRLHSSLIDCITLVSDQLSVLCVSVQLPEPSNFSVPALLCCLLLSELRHEMEIFWLLTSLDLNLVIWRENLVRDWPPAVALNSLVPSIVIVLFGLVKGDVDRVLSLVLLQCVVIARGEGIDVDHASMREDLVVDQWWEALSTQSEPDVAARGRIQETCFGWIDTLQ